MTQADAATIYKYFVEKFRYFEILHPFYFKVQEYGSKEMLIWRIWTSGK